ncbi:unnamed protein product [Cuscuta campestris]|uniref:Zinc finger PHD-type domain-containing protein n=1 Tax=Cuscuta campestris TaxID=132261 RepID=A0A484K995_9ASTE|nr:unnamed protein product [Cuscuta campestris]
MKARSHGLPMPNQQDDWGDGSWTVDCVCGVNFDDGEEMVDCDDCGVWVHTRCVRYVKSEKVFACDKCKNKNTKNDSEETEVAQLLVELPTKTLNMDNPITSSLPSQRPFRLWTELPMEDRVHVQGVPGGDPALFAAGVSSIFNPQLWKCTGYVPKKLNFQYREFSCWDTESDVGDDKRGVENNGTTADNNGADVLFSLSKESNFLPPMTNSTMVKSNTNNGKCNVSLSSKHTKRLDGLKLNTNMKKALNSPHSIVIHSGKRKQDGFKIEKEQVRKKKKKGQMTDKGDFKKKSPSIKKACKLLNGEKERKFNEDRGSKVVNADSNRTKSGSREGAVLTDHLAEDSQRLDSGYSNYRNTSNSSEHHSKVIPSNVLKENSSSETLPPEQSENQAASKIHSSQWEKDKDGMAAVPIKQEGVAFPGEALTISAKVELQKSESVTKARVSDDLEVKGLQISRNLTGDSLTCSSVPETEVKVDDGCGDFDIHCSSACDSTLERTRSLPHHADTSNVLLGESANRKNDVPVVNSKGRCHKAQRVDSNSSILGCKKMTNADGLSHDLCNSNQETTLSEDAERAQNSALGLKCGSTQRAGDAATKTSATTLIGTAPCQRKVRVTIGKSAATSSTLVLRPSPAESCIYSTGVKRGMSDNNLSSKGEAISSNAVMEEEGNEKSKKMVGELPKSSVSSASKAQMTKITYVSSSKRETLSDSKESMPHSSPRSISVRNLPSNSGSGESSSSLQSEGASSLPNKPTCTNLLQRGEKVKPPGSLSSLKANATLMHPPTLSSSPAALSDEELALLLHQQLNSSSRVPRVPRMRHAGSLPTLTSPTATSILVKRASSGGKDHGLSSRKRKESAKDGSISALEGAAESYKKRNGLTSDNKREDTHVKREADNSSIKSVISLKTSPSSSTAGGSNCVPSSHEVKEPKLSSSKNSQRNTVGNDARVSEHPARTLPGLIAEIMSKGERMTYEELCNAVLPHWPHLRKHNGERYAYSSHSQAVLDCLRNRSEWARLVDRGPKGGPRLTAGRKRRRIDDSQSNELDDENGDGSGGGRDKDEGNSKSLDQEELPKGRRKTRKRRHLTPGGRGKKDGVRRRHHRTGVISDDDDEPASFSSCSDDDTMFCEEDDDEDDDDVDHGMEGATASPKTNVTSPSSAP